MATRRDLPHNTAAERTVLGAMLRSKAVLNEAMAVLSVNDFFSENENHRAIFRAIATLFDKGQPVDAQTVTDALINANELAVSGGPEYLLELADSVLSFANIKDYLRMVKDQAVLCAFIRTLKDVEKSYYEETIDDISDFIAQSERKITKVTEQRRVGDFQTAATVSRLVEKDIAALKEASTNEMVTGINTGYPRLNILTHGFQAGELIVIAARPSVGKTAFALNLTYNAAVKNQVPVAFFSCEMPAKALMKRLVSSESNVKLDALVTGFGLGQRERLALTQACRAIGETKIYIDDTPGIKLLDLLAKARKLKAKEPDLGLIVVDYLGLIISGRQKVESRQQEVQYLSQSLKKLALELNVPVIAVAQLNRNVEQRESGQPMLSDLRESGSIEQDADVVMFLWRENFKTGKRYGAEKSEEEANAEAFLKAQEEQDTQIINVTIAKNRNGKTGDAVLLFRRNFGKFDTPTMEFEEKLKSLRRNYAG